MQNFGKTQGKTCIHGFNMLFRTHNILAHGTNRKENVSDRHRASQSPIKWNEIVFPTHLTFTLHSEWFGMHIMQKLKSSILTDLVSLQKGK